MSCHELVNFILVIFVTLSDIVGDVSHKLQYYEFLRMSDIERRTRRGADPNPASHLHQFWFKAFKRFCDIICMCVTCQ